MLGREVRAPVDLMYGTPTEQAPSSYDEYSDEMTDRMKQAFTLVRNHLHTAATRTKKYYDLRVRPLKYKVGDWVYFFSPRNYPGRQDKWRRKFSGPYLVIKTLGPVNVLLQKSPRSKPFSVHIDKVKIFETDHPPKSWLVEGPMNNEESDTDEVNHEANERQPEEVDIFGSGWPLVEKYKTPRPKRQIRKPTRFQD